MTLDSLHAWNILLLFYLNILSVIEMYRYINIYIIIYNVCKTSIGGPYDSDLYGLNKDLLNYLPFCVYNKL